MKTKKRKAGFYECQIKWNDGDSWTYAVVAYDMPSTDAKGDFMPYDDKVFFYFEKGEDMKAGDEFITKGLKYIGKTI